jgi:hypothetical protein
MVKKFLHFLKNILMRLKICYWVIKNSEYIVKLPLIHHQL